MISEQLRTTLLSLKQISDRLKSLVLTSVTKSEATANKTAILEAIDEIEVDTSDLAKLGSNENATNTAILNAIPSVLDILSGLAKTSDIPTVNQIQNGLATSNDVTTVSNKIGTFTGLNTVASKLSDIQTSIESVSVSDLKLQLFFGIEGTFEAEAVGGETTDNPVIDECKTRYTEVFGDLLPSDFVMPNSVTIDGTTYTGTVS